MRLVVFDVDGTLVDSQHLICASMRQGFSLAGLETETPARDEILSCVGLSLDQAIAELAPDADGAAQRRILAGYRSAYQVGRLMENPPLYDGAMDCLDRLASRDDLLLAIATGKSRRGLDAMIEQHGLEGRFVSLQTADDHPSKPHPAMLQQALHDTGVEASNAVMIGDSEYDIRMAVAGGMPSFGVAWGFGSEKALLAAGAAFVTADFSALTKAIEEWAA